MQPSIGINWLSVQTHRLVRYYAQELNIIGGNCFEGMQMTLCQKQQWLQFPKTSFDVTFVEPNILSVEQAQLVVADVKNAITQSADLIKGQFHNILH